MSKGGIGVGSASIVLVFAVLCLTIFSLISLAAATGDKSLVDAEVNLVTSYYEADTLAEMILGEILKARTIPGEILGIHLETKAEAGGMRVSFICPLSDRKELAVEVILYANRYDIVRWRMQDAMMWEMASTIPVWQGP